MRLQKLTKLVMIIGGVALAVYGASLLIDLPEISPNKFSASGADTSTALLTALIGVGLALYGWFWLVPDNSSGEPADEP